MKPKFVVLILLIQTSAQIYDIPTALNPTFAENYMRINGGVGSQGYWGNLQPNPRNIFSSDWGDKDYVQMYNINSLAPYGGDRYTGYDSLTQLFAPQGMANNYFHPTTENVNAAKSVSPNMADINSPMYRNFYKRYYDFYNTNLNLLEAKISEKENPFDVTSIKTLKAKNPKIFDYGNNYFDEKKPEDSFYGPQIPPMDVVSNSAKSSRKLELLTQNPSKRLKRLLKLKEKVQKIKQALFEIEDLQTKQERQLTSFDEAKTKIQDKKLNI